MNKTLFLSQSNDQDANEQPQGEARMREALGLRTDGTRVAPSHAFRPDRPADHAAGNPRRHRFVQEGEVPVEVMTLRDHGSRNLGGGAPPSRHRIDEATFAAEKMAREQAERAFTEIRERLREAQTKLGHAELARQEALALAADRQAQIEALQAMVLPAPIVVPTQVAAPIPVPVPAPRKAAVIKPAGRPRGRVKAPKPVKWWIKSNPIP